MYITNYKCFMDSLFWLACLCAIMFGCCFKDSITHLQVLQIAMKFLLQMASDIKGPFHRTCHQWQLVIHWLLPWQQCFIAIKIKNVTLFVSEWQIVIDDKFYEMGPRIHQITGTVEPRYKEVGYNKILL